MTLVESRMKSFPSPASTLTGSAFRSLYFTRSHAQIWNASGPLNPGPDDEQCPSSPASVQQPTILGAASGSYFPTVRVYSKKERKWPWTTIIRRNWLPQYERIVCLEFLGRKNTRGSCGCSFAWWNPGNVLKWKWNLRVAVDSCFLLSGLRKQLWYRLHCVHWTDLGTSCRNFLFSPLIKMLCSCIRNVGVVPVNMNDGVMLQGHVTFHARDGLTESEKSLVGFKSYLNVCGVDYVILPVQFLLVATSKFHFHCRLVCTQTYHHSA